ncbi:MAG: hypothetical protein GY810_13360 [Aureispira sp.]|nr:hypothetical protein [Aureispira sp.]
MLTKRSLFLWLLALISLSLSISTCRSNRFDLDAHLEAYALSRQTIDMQRQKLAQVYQQYPAIQNKTIEQTKEYLYKILPEHVFYYWYGTTWDFNGTTEEPRKGKIACGYFVTTTLKHIGFDLPRYKLAQQPASIIIKTLCPSSSIKSYNSLSKLKAHIDKQPLGLFIVGLDTHVGYLLHADDGLYFIHASYSGKRQVSKELWSKSQVLANSKLYMVGNLLDNNKLIKQWLEQQSIAIKK